MKYSVVQVGESWAVGKNKTSYFSSTLSANKELAEIKALELSALWYREQMDKSYIKWEAKKEALPKELREREVGYSWDDVLA